MASLSMVEDALVQAITLAVYPGGFPGASLTGASIPVYRGWPDTPDLTADVAAGNVNVSVFPTPGMSRNVTRWAQVPNELPAAPCALTAAAVGLAVTLGGATAAGQQAGIAVDGTGYAIAVGASDTPATVAAGLAGLIPGATAAGPVVTLAAGRSVQALTAQGGQAVTVQNQQQQGFTLSVWAPDYAGRDTVADAVDAMVAATPFLLFADGTAGQMRWHGTASFDQNENANLFRRDVSVTVEFCVVRVETSPRVLFPVGVLRPAASALGVPFATVEPVAVAALS